MEITKANSNKAILKEIGKRIQEIRIRENITQSEMAERTGLSSSTIARMESGYPIKCDGLISVMRELELLENLNATFPVSQISPMEIIQRGEKKRQRASKSRLQESEEINWKWGDEK